MDGVHEFFQAVAGDYAAVIAAGRAPDSEPIPPTERDTDRSGPPRHFSSRYVLLVEDDYDISCAVRDALQEAGYLVRVAQHGGEALRILDVEFMTAQYVIGLAAMPSVILLDIMMPVMSGPEFFAVLRNSRPAFSSVPVILMSADSNITSFQLWAANTSGLDVPQRSGSLQKPFALSELLRKVHAATGGP